MNCDCDLNIVFVMHLPWWWGNGDGCFFNAYDNRDSRWYVKNGNQYCYPALTWLRYSRESCLCSKVQLHTWDGSKVFVLSHTHYVLTWVLTKLSKRECLNFWMGQLIHTMLIWVQPPPDIHQPVTVSYCVSREFMYLTASACLRNDLPDILHGSHNQKGEKRESMHKTLPRACFLTFLLIIIGIINILLFLQIYWPPVLLA